MSQLKFHSDLVGKLDRYSGDFSLPDFLYDEQGNLDRKAMLEMLLTEEYGFVDESGLKSWVELERELCLKVYSGKCKLYRRYRFCFEKNGDSTSFPVDLYLPAGVKEFPLVVALDFTLDVTHDFIPKEEILDRGVAIARVDFNEITVDENDFTHGLARLLCDRSDPRSPGKLAVWAFAARRIGHFMVENGYVKPQNLYVAGHSRLGKTALLAAAEDEIFAGALCNNSGCSGAAISRNTTGEKIERICRNFPFFFNTRYPIYADREEDQPFDQHFLLALVAPRKLCVVANSLDSWADTEAQYLACEAASVAYEKLGVPGLDRPWNTLPPVGGKCIKGNLAFFHCPGHHFLGRDNWNFFIDFIKGEY